MIETEDTTPKIEDIKINRTDRELEEKLHKANEEAEREKKQKEVNDARKSLVPLKTLEKLLKEAIEYPSTHWLEPILSFD